MEKDIRTGLVTDHQTFVDMLRWNPHYNCLVLEGGFNDEGNFVYIPKVIAVIQDIAEIKKILKHLKKIGRAPPGVDYTELSE